MQNYPSPTPARRQVSHGTTGQTPLTGGTSSGSPSPIRRAPPSYESVRQSPEKSGKIQVVPYNSRLYYIITLFQSHYHPPPLQPFSPAIKITFPLYFRVDILDRPLVLEAQVQRHHPFLLWVDSRLLP